MAEKALDAKELLGGNITVKTHHVNRSDLKKKLGFLEKTFSKKTIIFNSTKFIRISRRIKQGKYRQ